MEFCKHIKHIRAMHASDLPRIFEIETCSHIDPWSEAILADCLRVGYHCLVLEVDSKILGFSMAQIAVAECHLLNICIDPNYQKQGLGSFLLHYILQELTQQHIHVLYLEVRASNSSAQRLYKEFGFKQIGHRKAYYPSPQGREDAIILALELSPRQ